jgi:hypothetical protein
MLTVLSVEFIVASGNTKNLSTRHFSFFGGGFSLSLFARTGVSAPTRRNVENTAKLMSWNFFLMVGEF